MFMKDAECSLVDNLIAEKLILPTFWPDAPVLRARGGLGRTGASGRNVGKISFSAIKLSTREHSASFMITGATENSSGVLRCCKRNRFYTWAERCRYSRCQRPCSFFIGQILGALKEENSSNRLPLSRSLDHGRVRAILALFIDTDGPERRNKRQRRYSSYSNKCY